MANLLFHPAIQLSNFKAIFFMTRFYFASPESSKMEGALSPYLPSLNHEGFFISEKLSVF